ncbi:type II toxin-antitoxin system Phd/YefM family antitoxin [Cellvibrio fontiphilus]|uniref:Antitoxin n=1 Tax=Cellvibrio fontiphilus TaxID=1815559 RepID=A0ABV7FBI7_9GAMM
MNYTNQIKPISYLKANAAEVLETLTQSREPLIITQNGEAKAVLQDVASYNETQETMALLKILALGNRDLEEGKIAPANDVFARARNIKE